MPESQKVVKEVELKLETNNPEQVLALLSNSSLTPTANHSRDVELNAVYFDTDGQDLRQAGFSLRLRQEDGCWIQTLKSSKGAKQIALHRTEYELAVNTAELDFEALRKTPVAPLIAAREIRPMFQVSVSRKSLELMDGDATIEISADQGAIRVGAQRIPFGEVELELKNGDPRQLFALASLLSERVVLRPCLLTKADRGYNALQPPTERIKADEVHLPQGAVVSEAFQIIARSCLRHLLVNEPVVRASKCPDAVHQMRVAVRRLRAAMTLFKKSLANEDTTRIKSELKWIGNELGRARDLDVYMAGLARHSSGGNRDPDFEQALAAATHDRDQAYAALDEVLVSDRYCRALMAAMVWIETKSWLTSQDHTLQRRNKKPAVALARKELSRRLEWIVEDGRQLKEMSPEERHEVRIELKKLRYGAEFFRSLFLTKRKHGQRSFLKIAERLQETLGQLNDLAVAETRRTDALGGFLSKDQRKRTKGLLSDAKADIDELANLKPFWA